MTTPRRPYRTDLSDARWALIEPTMTAWRAAQGGLGLKKPVHDLREIVNAILYVNRTGIAWEYLPHDFPPYKTVHSYFTRWAADGTTETIHNLLRGKVRQAAGRDPEPTAAIIDSQSVKTSSNVPEASQGIDAGKRIKGRKRHLATDVLGLLLVVIVTAASVSDTAAGRDVIDHLAATHRHISTVSPAAPPTASTCKSCRKHQARRASNPCPSGGPSNAPTAGSCSTDDSSAITRRHQSTPEPTSTGP